MKYIRFDLDFVVQQISYKSCRYPSLNTDKTTQDISIVAGQRWKRYHVAGMLHWFRSRFCQMFPTGKYEKIIDIYGYHLRRENIDVHKSSRMNEIC